MLRRSLATLLLSVTALGPTQAQIGGGQTVGKTFHPSTYAGVVGTEVLFVSRVPLAVEVVPIADLVVAGSQFAIQGNIAETTAVDTVLNLPIVLYSRSGIGTHTALVQFWGAIFNVFGIDPPQTLRSKWLGQSGIEHEIVTVQVAGEKPAEFVKRHLDTVNAIKAADPPQKRGP